MPHNLTASEVNSKKLDDVADQLDRMAEQFKEIVFVIKGTPENPGLERVMVEVREILFGVKGRGGIIQRVDIMWRIYIWLLCSMSGAFGYWLKSFVEQFAKP